MKTTERTSDNEDGAACCDAWNMDGRWRDAEAARCFALRHFLIRTTYLAFAIVPPRPLVTQTNKTARTYHRGAVSDLGLDTAVFLELDQVIEWIPRPCAEDKSKIETEKYMDRKTIKQRE